MVVINEKKDNRKYAFLMTLVPDKAYLESTHFAAFSSNYRKWQKGYSGYVFYHTIDGRFNNGWKFENGKVTMSVSQVDENGIDISMGARRKVTAATICTTIPSSAIWYSNCQYTYTISETQGIQNLTPGTCNNYRFLGYEYLVECYDDGQSTPTTPTTPSTGTGSTNGGFTGPAVPKRTDCTGSSITNGINTINALSYSSSAYASSHVADSVNSLRAKALSDQYEWTLSIDKSSDGYWLTHDNGSPILNTNNSSTSITVYSETYTYLIVHTHTATDPSSPSPQDFVCLCKAYNKGATQIFGNVVLAHDGTETVIYVSDPVAFSTFCTSIANSTSFKTDATTNYFIAGSDYANAYNAARSFLDSMGYSLSESNSYSLSYVLDHFYTGLSIATRQDKFSQFKEQKTNSDYGYMYSPTICP